MRRIVGPNACGALRADLRLGELVLCDQFVDRTSGRDHSFYDGPETTHVSAADPYCPDLRRVPARDGGRARHPRPRRRHRGPIQGPPLLDGAPSRAGFASMGWDVVNMTAYPEGHLARELELCYANVSMVTDYDVGVEGSEPVDAATVMRVFGENVERLRELLLAAIPRIGPLPDDVCANARRGARL